MPRREDIHRKPLPDYVYHHEAIPPKSLEGQHRRAQKSTDLNNRYETEEASDRRRERHEELERRSEMKRNLEASKKAYRACTLLRFL